MNYTANPRPDPNVEFVEEYCRKACAANPTVQTPLGMVRRGEYTYAQAMCGMIGALCNENAELTRALEKA